MFIGNERPAVETSLKLIRSEELVRRINEETSPSREINLFEILQKNGYAPVLLDTIITLENFSNVNCSNLSFIDSTIIINNSFLDKEEINFDSSYLENCLVICLKAKKISFKNAVIMKSEIQNSVAAEGIDFSDTQINDCIISSQLVIDQLTDRQLISSKPYGEDNFPKQKIINLEQFFTIYPEIINGASLKLLLEKNDYAPILIDMNLSLFSNNDIDFSGVKFNNCWLTLTSNKKIFFTNAALDGCVVKKFTCEMLVFDNVKLSNVRIDNDIQANDFNLSGATLKNVLIQDDQLRTLIENTKQSHGLFEMPYISGRGFQQSKEIIFALGGSNTACFALALDYTRHILINQKRLVSADYLRKYKDKTFEQKKNLIKRIEEYQIFLNSSSISVEVTRRQEILYSEILKDSFFFDSLSKELQNSQVIGLWISNKFTGVGHMIAVKMGKNKRGETKEYHIFDPNMFEAECRSDFTSPGKQKAETVINSLICLYGHQYNNKINIYVIDLENIVKKLGLVREMDVYGKEDKQINNEKIEKIKPSRYEIINFINKQLKKESHITFGTAEEFFNHEKAELTNEGIQQREISIAPEEIYLRK